MKKENWSLKKKKKKQKQSEFGAVHPKIRGGVKKCSQKLVR